ncbi:MAG TPA: hypothetical protein VK183_04330 [Flavobacterium sp.]|nr:hypothetical protein [Flavobacterium sp.]
MKKFLPALWVLLLATMPTWSQQTLPFTENFTKSDYQGDNQNWNIVQGADQALYFANNRFLLRYNGVRWEKYTLPNKTIIRSLYAEGDRIYCGSYKEFGYWKRVAGKMHYTSLAASADFFSGKSENEEIWKIFRFGDQLYFQSFNMLLTIDKAGRITRKMLPDQISYCYEVGGDLFMATVRKGIYRRVGEQFVKQPGWEAVEGSIIHHIQAYKGKIYVFTRTNGVFVTDGNRLVPWDSPLNERLKSESINAARFVGSRLAIGTAQQGLYLVDMDNGRWKNLNRQNAIRNNAILCIMVDQEQDLWLGLDNGIAHIEINSPVELFTDNSGVLGSVYAMAGFQDGFLFVTNHGAFRYQGEQLSLLQGSQGQVWDIYPYEDVYILGHNDGTFVFDGSKLYRANTVNGGWEFFHSIWDDAYFQANYTGIAVYKSLADLSNPRILGGFTKPIRYVAQERPGELWAADNYRSLYRIKYDRQFRTTSIENVSQQNGISNDFGVKIFNYKNEVLFLIDGIWYTYNAITGKLVKDAVFNGAFANISDIIPVDDQRFMVLRDGVLYMVSQKRHAFYWDLLPEKYYGGKLISDDTKAYTRGQGILLNLDDGFLSYAPNRASRKQARVVVEGYYQGDLITDETDILYNQPVEINAISDYYGFGRPELYYRVNGEGRYERARNGHVILNNLDSGLQEIAFYRFNGHGYVKVADYEFSVDRPWYFSGWMILVYMVLAGAVFLLYYQWNKFRYRQKLQLKEEELRHQKKILELQLKSENEQYIQRYEKHILELEVQAKSSEVAGKSLSIAKHGEMIETIKRIIEEEKDVSKLKSEIRKTLKANAVSKHEWETFETNLSQVHSEFIKALSTRYPSLTPRDIRLCVYLKMNMSSKEIAPLMNISFRGVELHRYRLRKKLDLPQEASLSKFMNSL